MIEVIVGIAIIAVVSTTVVVFTSDTRRSRRVTADIETLRALTHALHRFDTTVQVFPRSLLHLTTRPSTTDANSCGADFEWWNVALWSVFGPYYPQPIVGPFEIEIGTIDTILTRVGPTSPSTVRALLQIRVTGVRIDDALELNRMIDSDIVIGSASNTGTVQFPAPGVEGNVTLTWNTAIRGC